MMPSPLTEQADIPVILETVVALRDHVRAQRAAGRPIALVPTMGALHDGHLELVRQGLSRGCHVIVSIFVNPTQFGPNEDFGAYPRTWDADLEKLRAIGAGAVYHPDVADMYPDQASTVVTVSGVSDGLCGPLRPGHFAGVATIVTKLLLQAMPDIALFGEKDYQQLQVVKRLAADLNIPVEIIGVPVVRDDNGLALSSRNVYLSAAERQTASRLNKILYGIADDIRAGTPWRDAWIKGRMVLEQAGFDAIEYLEVRDAETLETPAPDARQGLRILTVVRLGRTRLLDNASV